jgi:hypothetical protein
MSVRVRRTSFSVEWGGPKLPMYAMDATGACYVFSSPAARSDQAMLVATSDLAPTTKAGSKAKSP